LAPAACAARPVEGAASGSAIHPLRGNVDTRLRKLESGDYDAIILAAPA